MSVPTLFDHQSYLNLETFRKNGSGVKTPVWFVEDGGLLFVRTDASSGKVDRLLGKKYGLLKSLLGLTASIRGRKSAILEIKGVEG